jgi:transcriptional regulator with XRE-family HTH domain
MNTPGQRIREARLNKSLSVREAAARIGMGKSSLNELENGDSKLPSAKVLLKMSEVLGVTARWIVHGDDGHLNVPTPEEEKFLTDFRDLSDDARKAVAAMITALKAQGKT